MQIRKDKYNLNKSSTVEIFKKGASIQLDLKLSLNTKTPNVNTSISGIVVDSNNSPINGAIVKLMDNKLQPLLYSQTNSSGAYSFTNIPSSPTYNMAATATGKLLTSSSNFTLLSGQSTVINFTLPIDINATLGAISGNVVNNLNAPLFGAVISLYRLSNNNSTLYAITYTDSLGDFMLNELPIGDYTIKISSLGYYPSQLSTSVSSGKITSVNATLIHTDITATGIISGMVSNDSDEIVPNADVVLYSVGTDNSLSPIAYTTTNSFGVYTFINVPIGSYLVKSTQSDMINVTKPFSTPTLPNGNYDIALGLLENSAAIDPITNFVSLLGGPNDGSSTITINVDNYGVYNLLVEYLSADVDRFLSIDINGINTGYSYNFPVGDSLTLENVKTEVISVNLNAGLNIIKFHGNGIKFAPDLSKVVFIFSEIKTNNISDLSSPLSYSPYLGILSNGAEIDNDTSFVSSIGGTMDGSSTIVIDAINTGIHNILIEYLSSIDSTLTIDVNGASTGTIYNLSSTSDLNLNNSKTFIAAISLNAGANIIKFHGDGINKGPYLGNVTLFQNTSIKATTQNTLTYNAVDGALSGEAIIETFGSTKVAGYIGGPKDGATTLTVSAPSSGKYNLSFEYLASDVVRPLKIDINGPNTSSIYYPPQTSGWSEYDIKSFTISIDLNQGNNSIKFHGNGTNYAPSLRKVILVSLSSINYTYNTAEGVLGGEAKLEKLDTSTDFAGYIGGPKDGSTTIKPNVPLTGIYSLSVQYTSVDSDRPLLIDINGINTNIVYKPSRTDSWTVATTKTFTIMINLNTGINTIKFHGDGTNYGPTLGIVNITSVATLPTNTPSIPTYNYNATNGILSGEAKIESIDGVNIVGWLGGPNNGAVTLGVNVAKSQMYNLLIKYISGEPRGFKVDVNTVSTNQIYNVEQTTGWKLADFKFITIPVNLLAGINIIKIYGDGTNYSPSILELAISSYLSSSIPTINIYRKTSLSPGDAIERKKFNIPFHTLEPLGIEIMSPCDVSFLVIGSNISGTADVTLHDVDNVKYISTINVNEVKTVSIPAKGELFLNIVNVTNKLGDAPFSFQVTVNISNSANYIITPTFDVRSNKIFNNTIKDISAFSKAITTNAENGVLMISENARLYFPKCKYVSPSINPITVLALHEQTIMEHNKLAGLDINATAQLDRPRRNFVLVSPRNQQGGYMSAGGTMLDTHPTSSGAYLSPGWGMFHEYGHLYEQGWSFIEIWNNMYSKNMSEKTIGFTWLWGNNRNDYENTELLKLYTDYLVNNKFVEGGFWYKGGLYFFVSLQETFGINFVGAMTNYYRNNNIPYGQHHYVVYAVAKLYKVNVIPYMQMYGYYQFPNEVIDFVIDNSTSTLIFVPNNSNFSKFSNISVPPTVKSIYAGTNQKIIGISNPNAQINVKVDSNNYSGSTDSSGKFSINIPISINENTSLSLNSTEKGKTVSPTITVNVRTLLSDNVLNFSGLGNNVIATIGFNPRAKTIMVNSTGWQAHSYFGTQVYFSASLYDSNGNLLATSSVIGTDNANVFASTLNGKNFNYGYYIKVTHKEPGRCSISGTVINPPNSTIPLTFSGIDLSKVTLYITANGIQYKFG